MTPPTTRRLPGARAALTAAVFTLLVAGSSLAQDTPPLDPDTLLRLHDRHRIDLLGPGMDPGDPLRYLANLFARRNYLGPTAFGQSALGTPLESIAFGEGPVRVLVWAQMGGPDPQGASALADVVAFLATEPGHPVARAILSALTVVAAPVVNPDGILHGQRRNAQGIDLTLDARRFAAAETGHLRGALRALWPTYALGLESHQETGQAPVLIRSHAPDGGAIGADAQERSLRIGRTVAASVPAEARAPSIPHDARSVPALFQSAGITTLVLAGDEQGDDHDRAIRFAALLAALHAIAAEPPPARPSLDALGNTPAPTPADEPFRADVLIRAAGIIAPGLPAFRADLALAYVDASSGPRALLLDVGDLEGQITAGQVLDGRYVHITSLGSRPDLEGSGLMAVGNAPLFVLRRSGDPTSAPYWLVHEGRLVRWGDVAATKSGIYASVMPSVMGRSPLYAGAGMERAMIEAGWGHDYDRRYPYAENSSAGWGLAVGYRFGTDLQVEAQVTLAQRANVMGLNLIEESHIRYVYDTMPMALVVSRRFGFAHVGAGPAVLWGSSHWWDERVRLYQKAAVPKPERGFPLPPTSDFSSFGATAQIAVPLPRFGGSLRPEIHAQHRWFRPTTVDGFGIFPETSVDFSSTTIGLALKLLL